MPEKFPSSPNAEAPEIETSEDREKRENAEQDFAENRATELFFNSAIEPLATISEERKKPFMNSFRKIQVNGGRSTGRTLL